MSDKLGHIYFEKERQKAYPDMGLPLAKDYSEETAEVIDHEVKAILDAQYLVAKEILTKHHEVLNEGAALVLKEESIEGGRLTELLEAHSQH